MDFHDNDDILNAIDQLRSQGISHYIDLPQIIVCGDQSSGKSSALEALSGIEFPRKDNLCTRFATEVILRHSSIEQTNISIIPGNERTDEEKRILSSFQREAGLKDVPHLIAEAQIIMGIDNDSRTFSSDVLRLEVSGPNQPHLTLVDLPGLFKAGNKVQSESDAKVVTNLVLSYMKNPRSIILAVISAKNDFANQSVTTYTRQIDPEGSRTLGLITKPDALFPGSESEAAYLALAKNEDVNFKLGWHVIRNRDFDTRDISAIERDNMEHEFFQQGVWATLNRKQVAVAQLRTRLSKLLRQQILSELPNLTSDAHKKLEECRLLLSRLGNPRSTHSEQRLHVLQIGQAFSYLIKGSVEGSYIDKFFDDAQTIQGYQKRLRAVVQIESLAFAKIMREKGHANHITDVVLNANNAREISINAYLDKIHDLIERNRGTELPGVFNPQIINVLFKEQSTSWKAWTSKFVNVIWNATNTTIMLILGHVADSSTLQGLQEKILGPALSSLKADLDASVDMIITQACDGHAITYNHYFTDNLQKQRDSRRLAQLSLKLDRFFGTHIASGKSLVEERSFDAKALLQTLTEHTHKDMDRVACLEAMDAMRAYYKVAMKTFVDNISALAIERSLLQPLSRLLCPKDVMALEDAVIETIARETDEAQQERCLALQEERSLVKALEMLQKLVHSHLPDEEDIVSIIDEAGDGGQGNQTFSDTSSGSIPTPATNSNSEDDGKNDSSYSLLAATSSKKKAKKKKTEQS